MKTIVKSMYIVLFALLLGAIVYAEEAKPEKAQKSPRTLVFTNAQAGISTNAPIVAQMNAEFMRKVMEASARIEKMKRQIAEREAQLYKANPAIKTLWADMIKKQNEINSILNTDKELAELKRKRAVLWTIMPVLPRSNVRGLPPTLMLPKK